jgi:hypothetical protein
MFLGSDIFDGGPCAGGILLEPSRVRWRLIRRQFVASSPLLA